MSTTKDFENEVGVLLHQLNAALCSFTLEVEAFERESSSQVEALERELAIAHERESQWLAARASLIRELDTKSRERWAAELEAREVRARSYALEHENKGLRQALDFVSPGVPVPLSRIAHRVRRRRVLATLGSMNR